MRKLSLLILFFSMATMYAQDVQSIQNEIDKELWKPFKKAFETNNGLALNTLYAEQVLRVTPKGIDTDNNFKKANLKRFENYRKNQTGVILDFWFDSRRTNASTSYEVGFYRIQLVKSKQTDTIYGQFHIVLKKIDGKWKITQDWDTTSINGKSIGKSDFEKQQPKQF